MINRKISCNSGAQFFHHSVYAVSTALQMANPSIRMLTHRHVIVIARKLCVYTPEHDQFVVMSCFMFVHWIRLFSKLK